MAVYKGERVALPVGRPVELCVRPGFKTNTFLPVCVQTDLAGWFALEADPAFQDMFVNKDSAALAAFQVAFLNELLVCEYHGIACANLREEGSFEPVGKLPLRMASTSFCRI